VRGAVFSAEQFDLKQISWHLRTIESKESEAGGDRELVDQTSNRAFPTPGLSQDEHGNICLRQQLRLRAEFLHAGADAKEELILTQ